MLQIRTKISQNKITSFSFCFKAANHLEKKFHFILHNGVQIMFGFCLLILKLMMSSWLNDLFWLSTYLSHFLISSMISLWDTFYYYYYYLFNNSSLLKDQWEKHWLEYLRCGEPGQECTKFRTNNRLETWVKRSGAWRAVILRFFFSLSRNSWDNNKSYCLFWDLR